MTVSAASWASAALRLTSVTSGARRGSALSSTLNSLTSNKVPGGPLAAPFEAAAEMMKMSAIEAGRSSVASR